MTNFLSFLVNIFSPAILLSATSQKYYIIKKGDTLYSIARKNNIRLVDLIKANPQIRDIDVIMIGDKINLPSKWGNNYPQRPNENLPNYPQRPNENLPNYPQRPNENLPNYPQRPNENLPNYPQRPNENLPNYPQRPNENLPNYPQRPDENLPNYPQRPDEQIPDEEIPYEFESDSDIIEQEILELVNDERSKIGISPLKMNPELQKVSKEKSNDMCKNNYFDHTSPKYGTPFDMLKSFNIKFSTAGENIAKGQRSADSVMNAWMNSPGHRKNILNPQFEEIGIGYVECGNTTYFTQMFMKA